MTSYMMMHHEDEDSDPTPYVEWADAGDPKNGSAVLKVYFSDGEDPVREEPPEGTKWVEITGVRIRRSSVVPI